jgi:conjugal transfer mating pair stabilization protein TraN
MRKSLKKSLKKSLLLLNLLIFINTTQVIASTPTPTCIETSRTCTQGAQTRTISGIAVYKDCWAYSVNYSCYTEGQYTDNCAAIKGIATCSQLSSNCQTNLASGACSSYYNKYSCTAPIANLASLNLTLVSQDQHIISEVLDDSACNSYANNSDCKTSGELSCVSGAQTRVINGLSVARDCWEYNKQYSCKAEFIDDCADYEDSCTLKNNICLTSDSSGNCTYYTNTYSCPIPSAEVNVSCGSQNYITFNQNQDFGKAAASLAMLQESAKELNKDSLTTFNGNAGKCSKDAIGFSNCCKMGGWSEDASYVTSYAGTITTPSSAIIDALASCSSKEKDLSYLRANRMCVYIGSYCDKEESLTGLCLSKKESYCCFNSKLSRLINEQGRPQIGKGWGLPKAPDCSGININDLQRIDFNKIDFSELYEDFLKITTVPNSAAMSSKVSDTVQNYYKDSNGGGQ